MFKAVALFLSLFVASSTAASCATLRDYVESACDYPVALRLTSVPSSLKVDKNNCDVTCNKTEWQEQPVVELPSAEPDKTYTIINIDPDAPNHEKGEYFLHWIVSNIKGEDLIKGDLTKAHHHTPYVGPGPPKGTGLHRYLFLAFQEEEVNQNVENADKRRKFALLPWIGRQTKQLCGPVAGVQFRAEH